MRRAIESVIDLLAQQPRVCLLPVNTTFSAPFPRLPTTGQMISQDRDWLVWRAAMRHHHATLLLRSRLASPRPSRMDRNWFIKGVRSAYRLIASAMQGLHVQLFLAFKRNETHSRACCCLSDRFGIPIIVFLCLDVRSHLLRRHQPECVSLSREDPSHMMGAAAGFPCNDARR